MLKIGSSVIHEMRAKAQQSHPRECCGILLGEGTRITAIQPAANVHSAPKTHFEIDPQALIDAHRSEREGGPQVLGYYHSHPTSQPVPSQTDAAMAARDGRIWAIIGEAKATFWRDDPGGFAPLSYSITEL